MGGFFISWLDRLATWRSEIDHSHRNKTRKETFGFKCGDVQDTIGRASLAYHSRSIAEVDKEFRPCRHNDLA